MCSQEKVLVLFLVSEDFFSSAGDGFSLISGFMNILCTPEKPLLQVLPIIQVSSVLKELPVLSLIVLVRAFSEKVCPGLMTSSTTLCVLY